MMANIEIGQIPKELISKLMSVEQYINEAGITCFRTLELMRYQVSTLNGCAYCQDMHFKEAIAAGEEAIRLYSVTNWRSTDYYSKEEQAILVWAEIVTDSKHSLCDTNQAFQALLEHLSVQQIANLTLAISQINTWNRIAKSFRFKPGSYQLSQN